MKRFGKDHERSFFQINNSKGKSRLVFFIESTTNIANKHKMVFKKETDQQCFLTSGQERKQLLRIARGLSYPIEQINISSIIDKIFSKVELRHVRKMLYLGVQAIVVEQGDAAARAVADDDCE